MQIASICNRAVAFTTREATLSVGETHAHGHVGGCSREQMTAASIRRHGADLAISRGRCTWRPGHDHVGDILAREIVGGREAAAFLNP